MGLKVTVKNLPMHLVFGEYNGQECEVLEEFHSRQYGTVRHIASCAGNGRPRVHGGARPVHRPRS